MIIAASGAAVIILGGILFALWVLAQLPFPGDYEDDL